MSVHDDQASNRSTVPHGEALDVNDLPQGMTLGENGRPAFVGTNSQCLDLFFKVVPDLSREDLRRMLEACWNEDCETTLALIFNIGNTRGGKQDKPNFYRAMLWLWEEHPDTFLLNLKNIAMHTSLKCVLDLLMYIIHRNEESRFSLEGALDAAKKHGELRKAIRGSMKKERRKAQQARQVAVKQEFAESTGASDVRALRIARDNLAQPEARVARGACVYCGERGHWKDQCPNSSLTNPPSKSRQRKPCWMEEEEDDEALDAESALFVGRAGKSQMARMKKQMLIQQSEAQNQLKVATVRPLVRGGSGRPPAGPRQTETAGSEVEGGWDAGQANAWGGKPVTMRWYSCTKWRTAETAARFRDFIQERDAAYAAREKARAKAERAGAGAVAARELGRGRVRELHAAVADLFAEGLRGELAAAREGRAVGGLHGKWAPTPGYLHDTATLLVDAIAERLFAGSDGGRGIPPRSGDGDGAPEDAEVEQRRRRYRKEVLNPIRELAKVPERMVGKGEMARIDYRRLPSRCRLVFGAKLFGKHDRERYFEHLLEAAKEVLAGGKRKSLRAAAILPHELTARAERRVRVEEALAQRAGVDGAGFPREQQPPPSVRRGLGKGRQGPQPPAAPAWRSRVQGQGAVGPKPDAALLKLQGLEENLLWRSLVDACGAAAQAGGAGWMVPVCDVSGSMSGEPMAVAVALSLLLAESAPRESPWRGKMFTFHARPKLVEVPGIAGSQAGQAARSQAAEEGGAGAELGELGERVRFVKGIDWGGSTDVDRVFEQLLDTAVAGGLSAEAVAALTVVIFSDMEFDCARHNAAVPWETAHEAICRRFRDRGYAKPPTLVYWNLRASRSVPVDNGDTPGVLLMSGFSAGMLKSFLAGNVEQAARAEVGDAGEEQDEGEEDERATALEKMREMLSKRVYQGLAVADADRP